MLGPALGVLAVSVTPKEVPQVTLATLISPLTLMVFFTCIVFACLLEIIREDVTLWVWIPGFEDSAITFVLGAATVYLSWSITKGVHLWLIGMGIMALLRVIGLVHTKNQAKADSENQRTIEVGGFATAYKVQLRQGVISGLVGAVLFFLLAAGNWPDNFNYIPSTLQALLSIVTWLITLMWLGIQITITIRFWKVVCLAMRRNSETIKKSTSHNMSL